MSTPSPKPADQIIKFPPIIHPRLLQSKVVHIFQFTHYDRKNKAAVYDTSIPLPIITFRGTVKLHGSNASIVQTLSPQESLSFQSRTRVLRPETDLFNFHQHMTNHHPAVTKLFQLIRTHLTAENAKLKTKRNLLKIAVFGEWCGEKIQKGVALSQLPKIFVIFAVLAIYANEAKEEENWVDITQLSHLEAKDASIFNIFQFPTFELDIDFNNEETLADGMKKMDELTLAVERECPVGKYFGAKGFGEGIVWMPVACKSRPDKMEKLKTSKFWIKSKGPKFDEKGASKPVKSKMNGKADLRANGKVNQRVNEVVETTNPKMKEKIDKLVAEVVTNGRLEQGLQILEREFMLPLDMTSVSVFMKWVYDDVVKEEWDRIENAGVAKKDLEGPVYEVAKKWFEEVSEEDRIESEMVEKMKAL